MEKKKVKIKIPTGFRIFAILKSVISQIVNLLLNFNDELENLKTELAKLKLNKKYGKGGNK